MDLTPSPTDGDRFLAALAATRAKPGEPMRQRRATVQSVA